MHEGLEGILVAEQSLGSCPIRPDRFDMPAAWTKPLSELDGQLRFPGA
jgi:hypothetical protein